MTLQTVTLKWDLADLIQAGLSATLSITPTAQMSDTTDHVLIPPVARAYTFTGGTGQLAGIVANDNSAVLPSGSGYLISVTAANGQVIVPQFQTQLLTANGATQWLDALAVVPTVATAYQFVPLPATGPADTAKVLGVVQASPLVTGWVGGGGGSGTVTQVNGVNPDGSGHVTLAAADVGAASTGALTAEATARASADTALGAAKVAKAGDTMTGALAPSVIALTDAATIAVNAAPGNLFTVTLGGNRTFGAPANPVSGQAITMLIRQPASGGPWTPSFASGTGGYSFGSSSVPLWSTAANATDKIAWTYDAGNPNGARWTFAGFLGGF